MLCCPHSIVYGIKFLLRGESPRAYVDMLLSLRCQPTLFVCDIPGHVSSHGNNRKPGMFTPHSGRFAAPTETNIQQAKEGKFTISLPCLNSSNWDLDAASADHPYASGYQFHPLTKTRDHYCAFDRLHQLNSTVPADRLRQLDLIKELKGEVNSLVVEELFSEMKKSRYFLTQLKPIHHIFLVRLILQLRNQRRNEAHLLNLRKTAKKTLPKFELVIAEDKRVQLKDKGDYSPYQRDIFIKIIWNFSSREKSAIW